MLQRRVQHGSDGGAVVYYASPLLESARVRHAFSTRLGGVSPPPFDTLNFGNPMGAEVRDSQDRINQNYERLFAAAGFDAGACEKRAWVHQVHSGDVCAAARGAEFENGTRADALVSDDPARVLSIRVADCVPILVSSEDGTVVSAIHAGWRGVIAGAVGNAIAQLRRWSGAPLIAAIGPCISKPNFEVGGEVIDAFERAFGEQARLTDRSANGKGHVDLVGAVRRQLVAAGVSPDAIDVTDLCTHRDADEFFSHRRDNGVTGRMVAVIAAKSSNDWSGR